MRPTSLLTAMLLVGAILGCRVAEPYGDSAHAHGGHVHSASPDQEHSSSHGDAHADAEEHGVHRAHDRVVYRCPMDCEHGRDYSEAVDCPECGMDTVVFDPEEKAHADHNPKHGGLFFMAPDQWHHVEGVMASAREFRVYLYNNYTKPLPATGFTATVEVVRRDAEDDDIGLPGTFELSPHRDGDYLKLDLPEEYVLPLAINLRMAFTEGAKPELFNFRFLEVSTMH